MASQSLGSLWKAWRLTLMLWKEEFCFAISVTTLSFHNQDLSSLPEKKFCIIISLTHLGDHFILVRYFEKVMRLVFIWLNFLDVFCIFGDQNWHVKEFSSYTRAHWSWQRPVLSDLDMWRFDLSVFILYCKSVSLHPKFDADVVKIDIFTFKSN